MLFDETKKKRKYSDPAYPDLVTPHAFLAEELLIPMVNRSDGGRVNMFTSQVSQAVSIDSAEPPLVFSRFENRIGSYTRARLTVPAGTQLIGSFQKNSQQTIYALKLPDGRLDIFFAKSVHHLTESYGYRLENKLSNVQIGTVFPEEHVIQNWAGHDDYGNMQYGSNLRTLITSMDSLTFEDAIIVSHTAAHVKMAHRTVKTFTVMLNPNDVLLNTYGDDEVSLGFPEAGEAIKDGILLTRRRVDARTILVDLARSKMSEINPNSDSSVQASGTVVDIDVYSNLTDELLGARHMTQIKKLHDKQTEFAKWMEATFGEAIQSGSGYTDDVAFWYRRIVDQHGMKWRYDRTEYEGVVLDFTVTEVHPLREGSKLANRCGGKGVVSIVRPDNEMPVDEHGNVIDIIVNSLGVNNRMNWTQTFELDLNACAEEACRIMKGFIEGDGDLKSACEIYMDFLSRVSPVEAEWIHNNCSTEEIENLTREAAMSGRLPIHQEPFFGNIGLDELRELHEIYEIPRVKISGCEEPAVCSYMYFMRLRHEPIGKMTARAAGALSVSGAPTRSPRGSRSGVSQFGDTPIRLGEQEIHGLAAAGSAALLDRLGRMYSTDASARADLIAHQLTTNPFDNSPVPITRSPMTGPTASVVSLLRANGLELVPSPMDDEE